MTTKATLRQLLWTCLILAVKVDARTSVSSAEKKGPFVNPHYELCERKQCLNIEDIFMTTVDLYAHPCDGYSEYACHTKYTGSRDHMAFSSEPDEVLKELESILSNGSLVREVDKGNTALAIERKIFELCQKGKLSDEHERQHYQQTVLNSPNGPNRLLPDNDYKTGEKNLEQTDLQYALKGFGFAFFQVDIHEESKPNDQFERHILLKPPSYDIMQLKSLLDEYFKTPSNGDVYYSKTKNKYRKLEAFMSKLSMAITAAQVEQKSSNIEFQKLYQWVEDYEKQPYHKCSKINWSNYLNKLFGIVHQRVPDDTTIAIQSRAYFSRLFKALKDTPDCDTIVDFVHLHFVSKSLGLADSNRREYSILPQIKGLRCTPGLLAGTAYKYADENFPEENRKLLEDLIARVKNAVIARVLRARDNLGNSTGLSTKQRLMMSSFVEEYENAEIYAGYPAWLMNSPTTYSIYGTSVWRYNLPRFYDFQAQLIENLLKTKLSAWKDEYIPVFDPMELSKGFESSRIEIRSKTIAGSPERVVKEIVIPFGYFNEKNYRFFSSQLFDPINYGAVATEIAFILYYDLLAKYMEYTRAPNCIRDQVPNYIRDIEPFTKRAIAYSLALDAAYEAWPSKNSMPIQFVDFGAIPVSDLFFLSFAQSLCSVPPEETLQDPESFQKDQENTVFYRTADRGTLPDYINFALRNFKPFRENYMCKMNQSMHIQADCDPFQI